MFVTVSCSTETIIDNIELNKLQTFIPGITYHLENTQTTFQIANVNDSRDPANVECFWEGFVQIDLVFESLSTDTLRLNTTTSQSDIIENYIFQLMEVEPYPELYKEIKLEDYRVTLNILEKNTD